MLEYLVFLCDRHPRWLFDFYALLLDDLTAMLLLLLQDLQGQLRVVIQLLQQIPNLPDIEQRVFDHNPLKVSLQFLLVMIVSHCAVQRQVMFVGE